MAWVVPFAMMTGKDRQYHNFFGPVIAWYNDFNLQVQRNIKKTHKKKTTKNAEIKTETLKSVARDRVIPMVDFFGWTTRGIPFPWKHMATRDQDEARSRTHSPTINLTVSSLYWYPSIKQRTFCPMLWKIPGSHGDCSWTHYWKPHRFPRCILCCAWLVGNQLGCCRFIYDWLRAGQNWASRKSEIFVHRA